MVFLRFSYGFPKVFLRFQTQENQKKTEENRRKPKENQKKTKRNPHLSVAKWRCLGVVPKDGLRGHSALDLICDPCAGRLCSSNMISGVLRCLWALQGA